MRAEISQQVLSVWGQQLEPNCCWACNVSEGDVAVAATPETNVA